MGDGAEEKNQTWMPVYGCWWNGVSQGCSAGSRTMIARLKGSGPFPNHRMRRDECPQKPPEALANQRGRGGPRPGEGMFIS